MTRVIVWLGGIALLAITLLETISVVGRHIGFPQRGSIELIQVAILAAGCLALVVSALGGNHARVRLVIDKLTPEAQDRVMRVCMFVTAAYFAALLAGSAWIALDLWNAYELSELMNVPWRWLRAFANLTLTVIIFILLRQTLRGRR